LSEVRSIELRHPTSESEVPWAWRAKRLKALEDETAKLKKLLAETMLDNAILKDIYN
jgi:hypothetical protein